jgi:hypothetical protein
VVVVAVAVAVAVAVVVVAAVAVAQTAFQHQDQNPGKPRHSPQAKSSEICGAGWWSTSMTARTRTSRATRTVTCRVTAI